MIPVKSFPLMEKELSKREDDNPSIPVTVGIILAHPRSRFANDHICVKKRCFGHSLYKETFRLLCYNRNRILAQPVYAKVMIF